MVSGGLWWSHMVGSDGRGSGSPGFSEPQALVVTAGATSISCYRKIQKSYIAGWSGNADGGGNIDCNKRTETETTR